jgi:hypothetical protein
VMSLECLLQDTFCFIYRQRVHLELSKSGEE